MTCCINGAILARRAACAGCPSTKRSTIIGPCLTVLSFVQDEGLTSGVLDRVEEWGVLAGLGEHGADAGEQRAQRAMLHSEVWKARKSLRCSAFPRIMSLVFLVLVDVFAPK
jgi:hypothetical protein